MQQLELAYWVAEEHLTASRVNEYAERFAEDGLVYLDGFLRREIADKLAHFVAHEASYSPVYGAYQNDIKVSAQEWAELDDQRRFFHMSRYQGPKPEFMMTPASLTYMRFQQRPVQCLFARYAASLTPNPPREMLCQDMLLTALREQQYLRPHTDKGTGVTRHVCIVFYLSPDWLEEDEGGLNIQTLRGETLTLSALFNRCIIFKPNLLHSVAPFAKSAKGKVRYSQTIWYA
ncbi:2OG-Fe(II) oxygenase [Hahella sp. HN01]|uniref:2OG-Fe(II) oxygenase n=1 Tax=unclassified Hahella TaxID=2624107 RepID=UPI001C1EF278|nr:2OG-Fe(II) oxygenase [Hahella sp. HN01]MBU6952778.1 2OG-Fe(II) oxygenase [Hahella sp. HN01]